MKITQNCVIILCALIHQGHGVSTKVDFDEESVTMTNASKENEDVEVKHTIVVSTKLKNSNANRRGLHSNDESGVLTYNIGRKDKSKGDSGEVPIIRGYKAVETTAIRSPDTRYKPPAQNYPDSLFINRNIRDDYDTYPNVATNPAQWKPSSYFNNINWWSPEQGRDSFVRRIDRPYQNTNMIHRKLADDTAKEFYCRKCRELAGGKGCAQTRSWIETTTTKMKIDGKLAKLN